MTDQLPPSNFTENNLGSIKPDSSWQIMSHIFTTPNQAYQAIQTQTPIWFPLLLTIGMSILVVILLFSNIDFEWYLEHMVEIAAGDASKAEQDQIRQAMSMMPASGMATFGAFSAAISIAVIFAIQAFYFVIVSGVTNDGIGFKQWFSFVCWSYLPGLVSGIASIMVILTSSNGQIAPETLNPFSLNALFFDMDAAKGLGNIYATTDLTLFWSMALMVLGYSQWTKRSLANSAALVLSPFALYYLVRFVLA